MAHKQLVALEIHDASLWEPSRVLPIIEVMERWGYNALVLHQNDLLDACTQLGLTANYGVSDLRLKKVRNATSWLNTLVERLAKFDAKLFLEIKEPSFQDYALELFPGLLGHDGQPDPTKPIWADFCRKKTEDLLARVPGLGGLIVNLSSPESRVSLPDHLKSTADNLERGAWFDQMIAAFSTPLNSTGKALYIRDFSYTEDFQSDVLSAVERCGDHVQASVKITANDYFPRAPENPVHKHVSGAPIIEVEAFGEHMGWGVIPNCRVEEFRQRFASIRPDQGLGLLVRISWEAITGAHALDSLSAVNVYALPRLAQADVAAEDLILDWLQDCHSLTGPMAHQVADLLLQSWDIPAAAYWDDQVFPRHSCLPSTWQEGWVSMETNGMGRHDLDPQVTPDNARLSEPARDALFADKESATALAIKLKQQAQNLPPDLPTELRCLLTAFDWLVPFAQQFEWANKATFYAARGHEKDASRLKDLSAHLLALANDLEAALGADSELPHHHRLLFDPAQIRCFVRSLDGVVSS